MYDTGMYITTQLVRLLFPWVANETRNNLSDLFDHNQTIPSVRTMCMHPEYSCSIRLPQIYY